MAKVIVERPRRGGLGGRSKPRKGYRRQAQRALESDGGPRMEGIRRRSGFAKGLNEHPGPLRRYLARQLGRPWNLVYSEICAHIRVDSAVQGHVRDHVDAYVTVHVVLDGRRALDSSGARVLD